MAARLTCPIERVEVSAYCIPAEAPEADGTHDWSHTTLVLVEAHAGGRTGIGYTYADLATAVLIRNTLARVATGCDAMSVREVWDKLCGSVRNLGRAGVCAMAVSAVDSALWDSKARLLDLPLVTLLGQARETLPVYGSGGFTNYPVERLREQLGGWAACGMSRVKMKVGRNARADIVRAQAAREAIGDGCELFVDANGAYSLKQALAQAQEFRQSGVTWFVLTYANCRDSSRTVAFCVATIRPADRWPWRRLVCWFK